MSPGRYRAIRHRELVAALIWMLPALPGPVLLAEMLPPLVNVADSSGSDR